MNQADLRRDLQRASADIRPHADPQDLWASGVRMRRRRHVMTLAGAVAASAAIAVTSVAVQAHNSASPEPRPSRSPQPPDSRSVPYITEDQAQPGVDPAELDSVPWDPTVSVRSWDPVDPVPLTENPVEHAAVAVQSDYDEPDAIAVLGDDGRWRSIDVQGLELTDSYEYDLGVTRGSLSADGTKLALGQTDGIVVIDLTTGACSTYDVAGLGPRWHGRQVFWSPDATTVYIRGASSRAVDLASGETHAVPFDPTRSAFLADGSVIEDTYDMTTYRDRIRIYDADGNLAFRSSVDGTLLDSLEDLSGRGERWAAQRIDRGWSQEDPRAPNAPASGVLVMGPDARPEALLPVKGYGANGGGGAVFGWRGDDTVLFRIYQMKAPAVVLAWNIASGRITRIADYHVTSGDISVVADYLPPY